MRMSQRSALLANAGPFAGVPPVLHRDAAYLADGGTPNPVANAVSTGCEFNQLAPHAPEGLDAPRVHVSRQHRMPRAPPVLEGMARHG